jgi:hypothetical protein
MFSCPCPPQQLHCVFAKNFMHLESSFSVHVEYIALGLGQSTQGHGENQLISRHMTQLMQPCIIAAVAISDYMLREIIYCCCSRVGFPPLALGLVLLQISGTQHQLRLFLYSWWATGSPSCRASTDDVFHAVVQSLQRYTESFNACQKYRMFDLSVSSKRLGCKVGTCVSNKLCCKTGCCLLNRTN